MRRILGLSFLLLGASVFLVRLHHAGPYAFPADGNLRAALFSLALGLWFIRPWLQDHPLRSYVSLAALIASPIVLFFALYAILAEIEEVVVVKTTDSQGQPAALRLWVMDADDVEWVNMPRAKADAHGLASKRVEFLRAGEWSCRHATLVADREIVRRNDRLGFEKYSVKRLAVGIGLFGSETSPEVISIRLERCRGGDRSDRS